ncbi:hypothetical protein [Pseudomonas aeruginosa]|uniref:hypothetical protein n=1 Tax=Pseudomonas aeruginosa TaxID=287 RepID=UPI00051F255F|nr:hypothetical protein [Pseudomonas aeruginosa]ARG86772.1 hypothetical protein E613_26820 [Pseudomonas aeruginosa]MDS9418885.1 hypothetical protein [Pseudomonas aeruginosa]MDS9434031.1 hypothetical protein [Pseudomonas aeruginosa]MDS9500823.1 hypothetical protein [Pseudomonas aeruginosa]MDS9565656.1 hypothetical protein [Pseudomonas aeruginosa]
MSSTQHQLIEQCAIRLRGIVEALDNIHDNTPHRWSTDLDDVHSSAESLLALIKDQAPARSEASFEEWLANELEGEDGQPVPAAVCDIALARRAFNHWPKLEQPAKVGGVRFSAGVSSRLVVEAAQRLYEFGSTPEKEAERIDPEQESVEQAGGDERVKCAVCVDSGKVYDISGEGPWKCYACTGSHEVIGYANGDELDNMLDDRTAVLSPVKTSFHTVPVYREARAALAQPSDEVVVTKNESGAIVSVTRQDKEGRVLSVIAESQPSPAQAEQAEAERPIVSFEKYMQVMYDRDENAKRLDAALARIAELEAKLSDPTAVHQWQFSNAWFDGSEEVVLKAGKEGSPIRTLYAAPVAQAQHSAPDVCDGKEQDAFEEWARKEGLDTSCHPMHWLFLDAKTNSARQGWKAALRYVRAHIAAPSQAQHSVPEGWMLVPVEPLLNMMSDKDHDTRITAERQLLSILAAAPGNSVPQAWLDVQAERRRQITAEGWTPEHDDEHADGQMAQAAGCYALHAGGIGTDWPDGRQNGAALFWPWDRDSWKPTTPRRDLVKACALALAEIERLDRAGISQSPQPGATTASS